MVKEYALYKGDDILAFGTPQKIANQLGIQIDTVLYYGTNAYKKRLQLRKRSKKARELVLIN